MRAGLLRKKITIQELSSAQNEYGEAEDTWQEFATVRAGVEPLREREYFEAKQTQSESTKKFRIRYLAGVTNKMRILYDGKTFDIESVIDTDERHRELVILAVERTNG